MKWVWRNLFSRLRIKIFYNILLDIHIIHMEYSVLGKDLRKIYIKFNINSWPISDRIQ